MVAHADRRRAVIAIAVAIALLRLVPAAGR
jgi:hypothetical protein